MERLRYSPKMTQLVGGQSRTRTPESPSHQKSGDLEIRHALSTYLACSEDGAKCWDTEKKVVLLPSAMSQ